MNPSPLYRLRGLMLALACLAGLVACSEEPMSRPNASALRTTLDSLYVHWRLGEGFWELEQYELAQENYLQVKVDCDAYLAREKDNPVILQMTRRVEARLAAEPTVRSAEKKVTLRDTAKTLDQAIDELVGELNRSASPLLPAKPAGKSRSETQKAILNLLDGSDPEVTATHLAAFTLPEMIALLNDANDPLVRLAATKLLAQVEDYKRLPMFALVRALNDSHPKEVVAGAAVAIGRRMQRLHQSRGPEAKREIKRREFAIPRLVEALRRKYVIMTLETHPASALMAALARFDRVVDVQGYPVSAADLILLAYLDSDFEPGGPKRTAAVRALGNMRQLSERAHRRLLAAFKTETDRDVIGAIAGVFGEQAWPEAVLALRERLRLAIGKASPDEPAQMLMELAKTGSPLALAPMWELLCFWDEPILTQEKRNQLTFGDRELLLDKRLRRVVIDAMIAHAVRRPERPEAIIQMTRVIRLSGGPVRTACLAGLVSLKTPLAIDGLIGLAGDADPVVAVQAAESLLELDRARMTLGQRLAIQSLIRQAAKQGAFRLAEHLGRPTHEQLDPALWTLITEKVKDPARLLNGAEQTTLQVQLGQENRAIDTAMASKPQPRVHYNLHAGGARLAWIYGYKGITLHLKAKQETKLEAGFLLYEIEVMANFDGRLLDLQIGAPTLSAIETLGLPWSVERVRMNGQTLTFKRSKNTWVVVYCQAGTIRRIRYRDANEVSNDRLGQLTPLQLSP